MNFLALFADSANPKPASVLAGPVPNWNLLGHIPVLNLGPAPAFAGQFNLNPTPTPAFPSVLGPAVYSVVPVSAPNMVWDAVTVGYGFVADLRFVIGGDPVLAQSVCSYAASRSRLLRSAYDFPVGAAPGPVVLPVYNFIETSERVILSFLLGQTIAMRAARISWAVPRLFHRSLYLDVLPLLAPGAPVLPAGLSPDFVCFSPLPGLGGHGVGLCLLEAKGTHALIDHDKRAADREVINKAFRNQIAPTHNVIPGGALRSGVSLACRDGALAPNLVVGQFWDPHNADARPVPEEGIRILTARYFRSLHAFLTCLEKPSINNATQRIVWDAYAIGFHIEMKMWQWTLLENLAVHRINEEHFFEEIQTLDVDDEQDENRRHNGDGLYLSFIDY